MDSLEWLSIVEKAWYSQGKKITIQHAGNKGEEAITCQGKQGK